MIIGYARLSRDDEKSKYVSIENQKMIIKKYAEENNMVIDKMFEDDGFSGYTMDRPDFDEIKHLVDIQVEIVSITNKKGMERVFNTYHPQILINAAAHKHVPLMEHNVIEAIENNR